MPTWFVERRLEWIKESLEIFGRINRQHIAMKFGVSIPQASSDLREAQRRWPDLMEYDMSEKHYIVRQRGGLEQKEDKGGQ